MDMLTAMRAVNEVAGQGSFAGAAKAMHMSAPSISRLVSELETDLGVRLFNRTTRHLAMTEAGAQFLRRCGAILEEIEALRDVTRASHQSVSGRLTISSVVTFGNEFLAPAIVEFLQAHPEIEVDLSVTNRTVDLIEDHVDLAIRVGGGAGLPDSSMTAVRIFEQRLIFVASPAYLQRHAAPQGLDDLQAHPTVKFATGSFGHAYALEHPGGSVEYKVPDGFSSDSTRAVVTALQAGQGIGLIHDFAVERDLAAGRLVRVLPEYRTVAQPIYAVYAHRTFMPARVRVFLDFLLARFHRQAKD